MGRAPETGEASSRAIRFPWTLPTLLNPQLASLSIATCNLSHFTTAVHLTLPTTTGMDAALTNVSFSNASVNGVRVVDAAAGASVQRVLDMLRAAKANRHR